MTASTTPTTEQLHERIAELEAQIASLKRRAFPLPDSSQLSPSAYRSICSELTGTGLFSDLGGRLWPCWVWLPDDGSFSESERRRHHDNARRFLGK